MTPTQNDRTAPDPAEMLDLIDRQQRSIQTKLAGLVPPVTLAWGVAWLLGFGALWAVDGLRPSFSLPFAAALTIAIVLGVVAVGLSALLGIRNSRGIRPGGDSAFAGTVYGVSWPAGLVAIVLLGIALSVKGMPAELLAVYLATAYALFSGLMYLLAGAIWHAVPAVWTGGVLMLIGCVAAFLPYPAHYLLLAVGGGGTFLVLSLVTRLWLRRNRGLALGDAR